MTGLGQPKSRRERLKEKELKQIKIVDENSNEEPQSTDETDITIQQTVVKSDDDVELSAEIKEFLENGDEYFRYLVPTNPNENNIYDLKFIEASEVDLNDHFTLSKSGFSHIKAKGGFDFTSLDTWIREYTYYHKLKEIKFFKNFFLRKPLMLWLKFVKIKRFNVIRDKLSDTLFILQPSLGTCLQNLHGICTRIKKVRLLNISPFQTYTLEEFMKNHENQMVVVNKQLTELFNEAHEFVYSSCCKYLLRLEGVEDEFVEENTESLDETISVGKPKRLPSLEEILSGPESNIEERRAMTYQELAAQKTACRRLTSFLRSADHIIMEALRCLILSSTEELLRYLEGNPPVDTDEMAQIVGQHQQTVAPLFLCQGVFLPHSDHPLSIKPNVKEVKDKTSCVLDEYHKISECFDRFISNSSFQIIITKAASGDETSLVDPAAQILKGMIEENIDYREFIYTIRSSINLVFKKADKFINSFSDFIDLYAENSKFTVDLPPEELTLDFFRDQLQNIKKQEDKISEVPNLTIIDVIQVDCINFKESLKPSIERCRELIKVTLPKLGNEHSQNLTDEVKLITTNLVKESDSVAEFVAHIKLLDSTLENLDKVHNRYSYVHQLFDLMEDWDIRPPPEVNALYTHLSSEIDQFQNAIDTSENKRDERTHRFSKKLEGLVGGIADESNELSTRAAHTSISDSSSDETQVYLMLKQLSEDSQVLFKKCQQYQEYQGVFGLEVHEFTEVQDLRSDIDIKMNLWKAMSEWEDFKSSSFAVVFKEFNIEEFSGKIEKYVNIARKAERQLKKNMVVGVLKDRVESFKKLIPLVTDFRNNALKERHYAQIEEMIGCRVPQQTDLTLGFLVEKDAPKHQVEIHKVAIAATNEQGLEDLLRKVDLSWQDLDLEIMQHKQKKGIFVIGSVDDILSQLEDSLSTISTMRVSRYVNAIEEQVNEWDNKLNLFSHTLDVWLECQRSWIYLENIFTVPDIAKQLPREAPLFMAVDKSWKEIMKKVKEFPNALRTCTQGGLFDTFTKHNQTLEKVQRGLEDYLDQKRRAFPRFYFLLNDDILHILAQSKHPAAIQKHLRKIFDNISSLNFSDENGSVEVDAMISSEGEIVPLIQHVKPRPPVEVWLENLMNISQETLKKSLSDGVRDYQDPTIPRRDFINSYPAQIVIAVCQIFWCEAVSLALKSSNPLQSLKEYKAIARSQINEMTDLVRGQLSAIQRTSLVALITIEVHNADIVDELIQQKVDSIHDFEWLKRLRYYYDPETQNCIIKQTNTDFVYGYEYLGASGRLVITPLTDRCYITLTGAMHQHLGGSPAGPAGTGKTETVKDLAKALGNFCVVMNCSEQNSYQMTEKLFGGLAQTGAWACLDEFNRIKLEVLSVIAQQLLSIRTATLAKLPHFELGSLGKIPLNPRCAVFITMNPGYAGRTELPDNLKVLFRPVPMLVPDYALIAEIFLYAEGFRDAKRLAKKMVYLYKLSSQQLSQQKHYDFGMRAVKTTLVMAGKIRRRSPQLSEDVVLIRAMSDSNLPKFLAADLPLFMGIVNDLFPGIVDEERDYGSLLSSVHREFTVQGKQILDVQVNKVLELYNTLQIRHGVMLVGPSGGGKSTVLTTLINSLTSLSEHDQKYHKVVPQYLNPKAITMGQLFGQVNQLTQDWVNGIVTRLVVEGADDTSGDLRWTVFDGPVDALWIENMNTVLDDNKMLTLPNGQRIRLTDKMSMIFEVEDLAVASPATVSRCGMVYFDPVDLPWKPIITSWLTEQLSEYPRTVFVQLFDQFEKSIDSTIEYMKDLTLHINCSDQNRVMSVCNYIISLLNSNLGPEEAINLVKTQPAALTTILLQIFTFSYIWGFGGSLMERDMDSFSEFSRKQLDECGLPSYGSVFDYVIDFGSNQFVNWSDGVEEFAYSPSVPFFEILVPTIDTVRYSYLLKASIDVNRPLLFTGVSGVGKSVIMQDCINKMIETNPKALSSIQINFSAQTSANRFQDFLEQKLDDRRRAKLLPPENTLSCVVFVDELNMPRKEVYGAQPPIELLRQLVVYNGIYDRSKGGWVSLENMRYVTACAPPGGGRSSTTGRLLRHFTVLSLPEPSDKSLFKIFSNIANGHFAAHEFNKNVLSVVDELINCTIELYRSVSLNLRPTPSKSHYTFNIRDLSKVIQGLLNAFKLDMKTREDFAKLWIHESLRQFHDRLVIDSDRTWFKEQLLSLLRKYSSIFWNFEEVFDTNENNVDPILFGDIMTDVDEEERPYRSVPSLETVTNRLISILDDYNYHSTSGMDLVFFKDAVEHFMRISRILRQPRGNALLVGVGGSGKQSLTRLACFANGFECFEVELKKNYGLNEFREDLRSLYRIAGLNMKPCVFLLSDTQITDDAFLEDVNNILNSGEVPGLFEGEALEDLFVHLKPICKRLGVAETADSMYNFFIQNVRSNLHAVLTMSPIGTSFRSRCRQFPSLINCCTIDWFDTWPKEALLTVARAQFAEFDFNLKMELEEEEAFKESLSSICVQIHTDMLEKSEEFYKLYRRRFYVTPAFYLQFIKLFKQYFTDNSKEITTKRDVLLNGLRTLRETNEKVAVMKEELQALQPELQRNTKKTEELLMKLAKDQKDVDEIKKKVEDDQRKVADQTATAEVLKQDAAADLAEALPQLNQAVEALDALSSSDLYEIKSFKQPPGLVKLVIESVAILLVGNKLEWNAAQASILSDTQLINKLKNYEKDSIPELYLRRLKKYIDDPEFQPDIVERQSKAAKSLCMWVRAMDVYSKVNKIVGPKRERLAMYEQQLAESQEQLAEKTAELERVEAKLAAFKAQYEKQVAEKERLQAKIEDTQKRFDRATKLTGLLADEYVRWEKSAEILQEQLKNLVGDMLISGAFVAYMGPFTSEYRDEMLKKWNDLLVKHTVPCSEEFYLKDQLSNPVQIREWQIQQLPTDQLSTENAIMVSQGQKWPLCIDPQGQANRWIKEKEKENGLRVIKMTPDILKILEQAINIGTPVLIEDVGEAIDPSLSPILLRQVFDDNGRLMMKFGDSAIPYDPNFRLYMTTKLQNPHYLPDVCIKVTLINFTVTMTGLRDQLLGFVVKKEKPELEEQRDKLVLTMAADQKQLREIEAQILDLVSHSQNVLDDDGLINTLNLSKETSEVISKRMEEAISTAATIAEARSQYDNVALRGSVLFFVLNDLPIIDNMYQYSLEFFMKLFDGVIDNCPKFDDINNRLSSLIDLLTKQVFTSICQGLFEKHKILFAFLIACAIDRNVGKISPAEWSIFLRGAPATAEQPNINAPSYISKKNWFVLNYLDKEIDSFSGICEHLLANGKVWMKFIEASDSYESSLPSPFNEEKLSTFNQLLLFKLLCEDKFSLKLTVYVRDVLGEHFIKPTSFDLDSAFNDSAPEIPIIFVLSVGADPTVALQRFAAKHNKKDNLHIRSLGQGQGPIAEAVIDKSCENGDWVLLQNCHLVETWMADLQRKVLELKTKTIHPEFRLFLSSMPATFFPVSVLQNGIKITNEPPKGLRANLQRTYNDITDDEYNDIEPKKFEVWRRLLFGLAFFHAVVQERRKYGPLGWNKFYEFNSSDFEISMNQLRMFLNQHDEIPWKALRYLTAEINHGGRVTDFWDRRLIINILNVCYNEEVLNDGYCFSEDSTYYIPVKPALVDVKKYVDDLPLADTPTAFRMHNNAAISFQLQELNRTIDTILSIQPRLSGATSGVTPEDTVTALTNTFIERLPPFINVEDGLKELFVKNDKGLVPSLTTHLEQEIIRFNQVIEVINDTCDELLKAIDGIVVMSSELESMFTSLINNQVPELWKNVTYPSLKPLGSWFNDLIARLEMINTWLKKGNPVVFWMSGFFFTHGFITGILQTHARKLAISIDSLSFKFNFLDKKTDEITEAPEDGVYVAGLFIDDARWNADAGIIDEPLPKQLYGEMPIIHFEPKANYVPDESLYSCPLYKTSERAGVLSTTGHSTNFVLAVELPSAKSPTHWVLRSVALLCQLDN
eukprot:TRINITY_DN3265_c0_g7_i1.p1 TRINITY_DN3265_c0_g7~~TRINITY_DN3265_c0_g7_i1.p1  ORF type:complete len:3985 (+),score=1167.19 TRINITY_DN3265_c0_g7_i1:38-11956(+)